MHKYAYIIFLLILLDSSSYGQDRKVYSSTLMLMGSRFEISVVNEDEIFARKAIDAAINEIKRIEKLISSWDESSQSSAIIRNAGIKPVKVDRELFDLIYRCKKVSVLTGGAFDITFASLNPIWKFDGSMTKIPDSLKVKESVSKINYQNIILDRDNSRIFLKEKGMRIGFGAIGKGYAANKARSLLQEMGVESGIVNASGDLITWGSDENGEKWKIGIADPRNKTNVLSWLAVNKVAVVTSGNYEKFVTLDNKRYSHIIDPRTGWPVDGIASVTIICPDAELSDALATSVFVLGKDKGLALIDKLKGIDCLIVTSDNEILATKNIVLNQYSKNNTENK